MRSFISVFAVSTALFICCGGSKPTVNIDQDMQETHSQMSERWNEEFDPMTLGDYKLDIDVTNKADKVVDIDQLLRSGEESKDTDTRSQIQGFRVQLISTRNEEEARAVMRNAIISFDEPAYREYDNPYYKIRVGDFKSRYEASKVQEKAVEMGFHEAWVVRAMIWDRLP
ncbi:SPOR domain-containing protein [candidate division KSB1 bacterium]|nr:SPOR domain-containing protein [candidate division KSB1 bacterium]RQW07514.1 MAG: SPOR domain-containing protein [candidate division KSB1 bacterium]